LAVFAVRACPASTGWSRRPGRCGGGASGRRPGSGRAGGRRRPAVGARRRPAADGRGPGRRPRRCSGRRPGGGGGRTPRCRGGSAGRTVDGGDRVEHALAPHVADGRADAVDRGRGQPVGDLGLDLPHRGGDTAGHPWPPAGVMCDSSILAGGWESTQVNPQADRTDLAAYPSGLSLCHSAASPLFSPPSARPYRSKAPMSMTALPSPLPSLRRGKPGPRWSVVSGLPVTGSTALLSPWSIAGLPARSAIVCVGPPLFRTTPSLG